MSIGIDSSGSTAQLAHVPHHHRAKAEPPIVSQGDAQSASLVTNQAGNAASRPAASVEPRSAAPLPAQKPSAEATDASLNLLA